MLCTCIPGPVSSTVVEEGFGLGSTSIGSAPFFSPEDPNDACMGGGK